MTQINQGLDLVGVVAPAEGAGAGQGANEVAREQVRRLAQEFEALLLTQMLRDMRRSMVDDEPEEGGFGALTGSTDAEFGRAMTASGGFGLSAMLLQALERLQSGLGTGDVAPEAGGLALGAVASGLGAQDPVSGPVTSGFGWRQDPITGAPAFHGGVDLALAYGLEVRAAAEGRVTFAGEQGGYGNVVRVAHADGRETRYAHLSEPRVRAGDWVDAGQVIGRSGSSGRSTGPHLHFEVLVDGRPVDPARGGSQR